MFNLPLTCYFKCSNKSKVEAAALATAEQRAVVVALVVAVLLLVVVVIVEPAVLILNILKYKGALLKRTSKGKPGYI